MLRESGRLEHGMTLELRTPAGGELKVRRRGSTASGKFFVQQKKDSFYVEYRYFKRGSSLPTRIHIGTVVGIKPMGW